MVKMLEPKLGERVADFACGTGGFLTSTLKVLEPHVKTVEDREKFNNSIYGIEKKPLPYLLCITNMLIHDIESPFIYHGNSLERNVKDYKDEDKFDIVLMQFLNCVGLDKFEDEKAFTALARLTAELGTVVKGYAGAYCNLGRGDLIHSLHLLKQTDSYATAGFSNHAPENLYVFLINASTNVVKAMRVVELEPHFSDCLWQYIQEQFMGVFDMGEYDAHINAIYQHNSNENIARATNIQMIVPHHFGICCNKPGGFSIFI